MSWGFSLIGEAHAAKAKVTEMKGWQGEPPENIEQRERAKTYINGEVDHLLAIDRKGGGRDQVFVSVEAAGHQDAGGFGNVKVEVKRVQIYTGGIAVEEKVTIGHEPK